MQMLKKSTNENVRERGVERGKCCKQLARRGERGIQAEQGKILEQENANWEMVSDV